MGRNTAVLLRGQQPQACLRYSSSGGRVVPKILGTSLVISTATVGGVVGYAAVDKDFRKMVEESIPGTNELMDMVLGKEDEVIPTPKPSPSKLRIPSSVVITKPKVEEKPEVLDVPQEPASVSLLVTPADSLVSEDSVPAKDIPSKLLEITDTPVQEVQSVAVVETSGSSEETIPATTEVLEPVQEDVQPPPEEQSASEVAPPQVELPKPAVLEVQQSKPVETKEEMDIQVPAEVAVDIPKIETDTANLSDQTPENEIPSPNVGVVDDAENGSLEGMLSDLCSEMQDSVSKAVKGYDASSEAVVSHIDIMQKVLESNLTTKDESVWNEMFLAARKKSEKDKMAETMEKEAMSAIANVLESISVGRRNKVTSTNPKLLVAEEEANRAIYILDQAKSRRATVQSEASVMEEYKDLVEAGREQFHKEMASIMPDVKLGEKNGKLTEEELNMFITHAYKKVLFLQQEVAKQQTLEQERFKKALDKQRTETENLAAKHVQGELERQAREMTVEHEKRMAAIKEDGESELRAQLKRQAAAHTDHLADVLSVQEAELTRHHQHEMAEQVDSLTSKQMLSMSSMSGTVSGLVKSIDARAASDSASLSSQALWLACSNLNNTLSTGEVTASNWDEKLKPLSKEIEIVKTAAGGDEFVEVVLSSISPVALERGVYTEDSLKERFAKVEMVARKVAGVGEEGGSLLTFGLSYLQSILMVNLEERNPGSLLGIDMSKVSTIDLVTMAKHSLDRGDLARAVQVMGQVKGEAGRVVSDWLGEARLTLETMQAVQAMMVHSLATSCSHLPSV